MTIRLMLGALAVVLLALPAAAEPEPEAMPAVVQEQPIVDEDWELRRDILERSGCAEIQGTMGQTTAARSELGDFVGSFFWDGCDADQNVIDFVIDSHSLVSIRIVTEMSVEATNNSGMFVTLQDVTSGRYRPEEYIIRVPVRRTNRDYEMRLEEQFLRSGAYSIGVNRGNVEYEEEVYIPVYVRVRQ